MLALAVLALTGVPASRPAPGPPPGAMIHHHIHVSGRLEAGATLTVYAYQSYDLPNAPGFTGAPPSTLCYQHGTSQRLCTRSQISRWTVRLLPGNGQFLTLELGGKTVARVVYRVRIPGPPAPAEAPRVWTPPPPPPGQPPDPRSAAGGLNGPATLKVGEQAYFWGPFGPGTLCYRHGTSRVSCTASARDGFYLTIQPSRDQYFTLRIRGREVSRLAYHHVT